MSSSINHLVTKEAWDLISSCNTISATLNKLFPVRICGSVVMGLVDSDNSFYNVISSTVAKKIGLTYYQPYDGPPVGTASVGYNLDIVWLIHSTTFSLTEESGKEHKLTSRLVIVKHLSCRLNISLPFLVEHGLDQLHSQGALLMSQKNVKFPLYRNLNHTRQRLKVEKIDSPRISIITLVDNSITVSNQVRHTIPPRTGSLIPTTLDKTFVGVPTDSVFSFKNAFISKINKLNNKLHPDQDESYLGLNSIDQAVLVSDSNDVEIYFFNESFSPVTISSNCVIGSILVPEHHPSVVDMTSGLTIAPDSSSESLWMNNVPLAELSHAAHAHRCEHVHLVLDISNNPTLLKHPNIAGQLIDLIMIFWNFFTEMVIVEELK